MKVFKNIYEYRELLKTNVKKDIRGKYKKSFFGIVWSFLNPLLQLAVYAIIFPIILKVQQENYVIFVCSALIPWTFFTTVVSQSSGIIIANANIIKKVYFPREILPISVTTSAAINFLISTLIILAFVILSGLGITWHIIFYPLVLLVQYILSLGICFILSSVTVYFRDLEHFVGIGIMLLFYATPIVYSINTIESNYASILKLNPMAHIIEAYRSIFYYQSIPNLQNLGIILAISIAICIIGYCIFKKLEKRFAEEV
ncbi:MAG: ABC transporter permease [Clostridiales bacterium]|nr:ABC transporter permease [Clostridiales bacterium]